MSEQERSALHKPPKTPTTKKCNSSHKISDCLKCIVGNTGFLRHQDFEWVRLPPLVLSCRQALQTGKTLCVKWRPAPVGIPVYHSVAAHMFSQASCLCVRGRSVWEPLAFHTHLLTSLNSRRADSWVLPWPWGSGGPACSRGGGAHPGSNGRPWGQKKKEKSAADDTFAGRRGRRRRRGEFSWSFITSS